MMNSDRWKWLTYDECTQNGYCALANQIRHA
jgi:hypothetical protein